MSTTQREQIHQVILRHGNVGNPTTLLEQIQKVVIEPPDFERCQCEWLGGSFMTLGPRPTVRCEKSPTSLAIEREPQAVGGRKRRGSMTLCDEHVVALLERDSDRAVIQRLDAFVAATTTVTR